MEAAGKRYILYGSRSDQLTIWHLADLHLMSKACAEDVLKKDIARIKDDPYSFWQGGGDYCDLIGCDDRRFDPDAVAEWVNVNDLGRLGKVGMKRVAELLEPIKHKCLGLLTGNHEKTYERHKEQAGLHGWLCTELGVPNLEYCALFDVVFIRDPEVKAKPRLLATDSPFPLGFTTKTYRIFAHHGSGFATTPGGKLNKLIQFMQSFVADVYFCGHVHDKVGRREPALGADKTCTKLVAIERLGVISGSYLKTYQQGVTTYGEMRGYRPVSLGAAWVRFEPDKGKMYAEI